jgi:spermidine synthase
MAELVPDPTCRHAGVVRVGGTDQSYVDLDDPTHLEFDYLIRIADHLDTWAPAGQRLRVIHVGGAGMSLARYLAHTRPRSPQIVLEPDEDLTAWVRQALPLPLHSGIKVRGVDGRAGIAVMPSDYADVVIVDAFAANQVPSSLVSREFFDQVKRVLHSDGLLVMNVCDHRDLHWSRRLVATLASGFSQLTLSAAPGTFRGRAFGNMVLAASERPHEVNVLRRHAAADAFPYRVLDDEETRRFSGGAAGFTDQDAVPSPAPPLQLTWFD